MANNEIKFELFNYLPVELKFEIFQKLQVADQLISRKVCQSWLKLMNCIYKAHGVLTDNNESFQVLTNCLDVNWNLESLRIENFKQITALTNKDETICQTIPSSKKIIIGDGNSEANVLNLLQYYSMDIKSLLLESFSLANVLSPMRMRANNVTMMENLHEFSFSICPTKANFETSSYNSSFPKAHDVDNGGFEQQIRTMTVFLSNAKFPNLNILLMDIFIPFRHDPSSCNLHVPFQQALETFAKNHRATIQNLKIFLDGKYALPILHVLKYLTNIRSLFFGSNIFGNYRYSQQAQLELVEGLSSLVKLKSFTFRADGIQEANFASIMKNLGDKLASFTLFNAWSETSKLSSILHASQLESLELIIRAKMSSLLPLYSTKSQQQLKFLKSLNLWLIPIPGPFLQYDKLFNWIIQFAPNLQLMNLNTTGLLSNTKLTFQTFATILFGCEQLVKLTLSATEVGAELLGIVDHYHGIEISLVNKKNRQSLVLSVNRLIFEQRKSISVSNA